jgi:hypothetical protein
MPECLARESRTLLAEDEAGVCHEEQPESAHPRKEPLFGAAAGFNLTWATIWR